jgi:hypothetical protein
LPQLHTLTAFCDSFANGTAAVGFFTDLLPRLRVFRFVGLWWPTKAATAPVAPLPQLEELVWREYSRSPPITQLTGFLGARPTVLHVPFELIAESLPNRGGEPASGFLSRVCELYVTTYIAVSISEVARMLRAAPRLRTFSLRSQGLAGDTSFLTAPACPRHPEFVDYLVHSRLRHLEVTTSSKTFSCDDGCALRLRRTCFPRLREMKVNDVTFSVTPTRLADTTWLMNNQFHSTTTRCSGRAYSF